MDALSDVLRASSLTGGVFLQAEFTEPWCITAQISPETCAPYRMDARHVICFHYVIEGRLRVQIDEHTTMDACEGDVLLFPRNDLHLMGSDLSLAPTASDSIVRQSANGGLSMMRHGGGGATTRIICGFLGCDCGADNPVIAALPPVFKIGVINSGAAEWIRSTFQFAADEITRGRPGSETVLSKLSELLFVGAIRRYTEQLPDDATGWLAGLKDPFVSRALALLHGDIARHWTVEELSREVGLSRSAFAERFAGLIGKSPIQYLTAWRMQRAADLLRDPGRSLSQIAVEVGYESDAAFSRAFKKAHNAAPATWRRASAA